MKIAILSDIHCNKPALDAVYQDAKRSLVDIFWCLGDVVGYGPWPIQCWKLLENTIKPRVWLPGNHEMGLLRENSSYCQGDAKTVIDKQRVILARTYSTIFEQIESLTKNYVVEPVEGIHLAHGIYDTKDIFESMTAYVENIEKNPHLAEKAVAHIKNTNKNPKLLVTGHTHKPMLWQRIYDQGRKKHQWVKFQPTDRVPLNSLETMPALINPGSVGQPRDGSLSASYCILEWEDGNRYVDFRRVPYPIELTIQAMKDAGYPKTLIEKWYVDRITKLGA